MDPSHYKSPRHSRCICAGDTEVVSMKNHQRRGVRSLPWAGAALLLAFQVGAVNEAWARPFNPIDPPLPNGDPTADDQPSPTPKQGRTAASASMRKGEIDVVGKAAKGRLIWLSYVRAWIRISAF